MRASIIEWHLLVRLPWPIQCEWQLTLYIGPLCNKPVAIPLNQDPNVRMEQHITMECSVMTGKRQTKSTPVCARGKCGKVLFAPISCKVCSQHCEATLPNLIFLDYLSRVVTSSSAPSTDFLQITVVLQLAPPPPPPHLPPQCPNLHRSRFQNFRTRHLLPARKHWKLSRGSGQPHLCLPHPPCLAPNRQQQRHHILQHLLRRARHLTLPTHSPRLTGESFHLLFFQ